MPTVTVYIPTLDLPWPPAVLQVLLVAIWESVVARGYSFQQQIRIEYLEQISTLLHVIIGNFMVSWFGQYSYINVLYKVINVAFELILG